MNNHNDLENEKIKVFFEVTKLEQEKSTEIRFGANCQKCNIGTFDYDGMLNLVCSHCGYTSGGCFT